jgi:acetyl coenzyme A synthetase (ADP forming)-like protein
MVRTLLSEDEGYELLKTAGVTIPRFQVAHTADDAATAAESVTFPAVMKVISPDIIHKSDAGGVITGIGSAAEAQDAFVRIRKSAEAYKPGAVVAGIMVEQQLPPGLELIIGGKTDPTFGKVITVGLGGKLVELLHDVAIAVLPVDEPEIRSMIHGLRGYRLIAGFRDEPKRDEEALVSIISAINRMFLENPHITEFDINPLILYTTGACAVDARFYVDESLTAQEARQMPEMESRIMAIHSIAVVGASTIPSKVGYAICRNLLTFPGELYPVNPGSPDILGRKSYPGLASIPGNVDLAVIAIPAAGVPRVIEEAGQKKIPLVIVISSGFRETGKEGAALEEECLSLARKYGIRIMGPNCLGLMLPHLAINTTFDPVSARPGNLAFISQSGAIITTIVDWSLPEEIGFSAVVSIGNQADLTFEDFITWAGDDPHTKSIILYVEQIRYGKRFMDTVRKISNTKPIVAIKSGASRIGQKAASSHTGSLAGSYDVYRAAFHQAGVIPTSSIREAFQAAELLASEGYPKGTRAVIITNAGGFGVLASDYAERYGIGLVEFSPGLIQELDAVLPADWSRANPIDMVGDSSADQFARTFNIMIQHQDLWDIAFVIAVPTAISDPIRVSNELVRFSKNSHKMIVGCMIGGDSMKTPLRILRDGQIPNFPDLEDAFRAVGTICRHRCSTGLPECRHD